MLCLAMLVASASASSNLGSNYVLEMQKCEGAKDFTLHGLWPPENGCGGAPFNDTAVKDLLPKMKVDWLSCPEDGGDNEQFWSHEWEKHGTCSGLSEHDFFSAALKLRDEYASTCHESPCRLQCDGVTGPCSMETVFLRGAAVV